MRTHWVGKCHFICSCYKIQFRQSFGLIYLWHWVSTRGPILVRRPKNYPGPSHQDLHRGRHWVSSSCSNRFALISLFCLCVTFEPMLKTVSRSGPWLSHHRVLPISCKITHKGIVTNCRGCGPTPSAAFSPVPQVIYGFYCPVVTEVNVTSDSKTALSAPSSLFLFPSKPTRLLYKSAQVCWRRSAGQWTDATERS